jgi:hypothetical protein
MTLHLQRLSESGPSGDLPNTLSTLFPRLSVPAWRWTMEHKDGLVSSGNSLVPVSRPSPGAVRDRPEHFSDRFLVAFDTREQFKPLSTGQ